MEIPLQVHISSQVLSEGYPGRSGPLNCRAFSVSLSGLVFRRVPPVQDVFGGGQRVEVMGEGRKGRIVRPKSLSSQFCRACLQFNVLFCLLIPSMKKVKSRLPPKSGSPDPPWWASDHGGEVRRMVYELLWKTIRKSVRTELAVQAIGEMVRRERRKILFAVDLFFSNSHCFLGHLSPRRCQRGGGRLHAGGH